MRGLAVAAALALPALFPMGSKANFVDGNDLHKWCQSKFEVDKALCLAYVMGTQDMITTTQEAGLVDFNVCTPDKVKASQLNDIVKKWLADNPKTRHELATLIVKHALEKAYPCKK